MPNTNIITKMPVERLRWVVEDEFALADFAKYDFDENMYGRTVATADQYSLTWRVVLCPKGSLYGSDEERDHMGVFVMFGPFPDPIDGDKKAQVYKVEFTLQIYSEDGRPFDKCSASATFSQPGHVWGDQKAFPMAPDQLKPYLLGEEGSQFVRVRVKLAIAKSAFDPLALLPPTPPPRQDMAKRFEQWYSGGNGFVTITSRNGKKFQCYKDLLTEASDAFKAMLDTAMKEGNSGCVTFQHLDSDALAELLNFITCHSTEPDRLRRNVIRLLDASESYLLPDLKDVCERAVVEIMQQKKLAENFLDLLKATETYNLRVASNVGLTRLLADYARLSDDDNERFHSPKFSNLLKRFVQLSCRVHCARKC